MLKRFKNWLIKLLGGYTKAEYDTVRSIPIAEPKVIVREVRRTVELCADRIVGLDEIATRGWSGADFFAREDIVRELARGAAPHIEWAVEENRMDMSVRIRGRLTVMADTRQRGY